MSRTADSGKWPLINLPESARRQSAETQFDNNPSWYMIDSISGQHDQTRGPPREEIQGGVMLRRICLLVTISCSSLPLPGQEARGTILGRVADQTDAVIVAAKVEATNVATGVPFTTLTNAAGDYILPFLISGTYEVKVESQGFRTYTRSGIELRESERVPIDVTLQVGEASQSVAVRAEVPILDTSTASMG